MVFIISSIYKLSIIYFRFTNRDSIILHRKQHTKQKTHFCSICNKGFYKQSCLSRHQRSHTGERPFQCEYCKKSFSQSTSVKSHKAKCHPEHEDSFASPQIGHRSWNVFTFYNDVCHEKLYLLLLLTRKWLTYCLISTFSFFF